MIIDMFPDTESLSALEPIVVAVSRDGNTITGTGFYINQELVVTCYHVLSSNKEPLEKQYWIRHNRWDNWVRAEPLPECCYPPPRDTAILRCTYKLPGNITFRFAKWDADIPIRDFLARGYDHDKTAFDIGATNFYGKILGVTTYKKAERL
jgi:hypothetical protein